jgi:hypothetical protein
MERVISKLILILMAPKVINYRPKDIVHLLVCNYLSEETTGAVIKKITIVMICLWW